MELTQAQADKINDILGVSFVDLDDDDDAEYYLEALEDGECKAEDQAAVEEAHAFIKHILNRSVSEMLKDELPELVEEHGIDAIAYIYAGVEESLGRTREWSSECVKEYVKVFFDKYYAKTYQSDGKEFAFVRAELGEDMDDMVARHVDWRAVQQEYIEDETTIIIDGEHGELVFISENGFYDDLYKELMYWA
jgi:hypothetical protein